MKILELFSGYGTASFALKRLGITYELMGYSDIDKWANQVFKQNHCPWDVHDMLQLGDVKKVDEKRLPDFDLLTSGFPCQAFSAAGKGLGELDPRGTLFYEIIRIAEHKQPKYMLLENVKGLTFKKFKPTFEKILSEIDRIGYTVYWKVLNSKDFGVPQSRARIWFVCFRKDVEHFFEWPQEEELTVFIKDILDEGVDEKYYLSDKLHERFQKYLDEKETKIVAMRGRNPDKPTSRVSGLPTEQRLEVQKEPISNTISTVQKDNLVFENKIKREQLDSSGKGYGSQNDRIYWDTGVMCCLPNANPKNKVNIAISNCSRREVGFQEDVSPTLCARDYKDPKIVREKCLRRLTPTECFRLMGFFNDEINLEGISDTQKYKLAGNGQDVNLVTKIFERMFC